ncbi:MAG: helix-hairpin-helix domain-containing protein [Lachnospiraceae bacterium]|nr:helix-hairpin-helix domain-containing protein [Lachnospiraceae bacterium]
MKKSILNILSVFILSIVMALSSGCDKEDAVIDLERESVLNDPTLSTYDEVTVRSDDDGREKRNPAAESEPDTCTDITVYVCGAVNRSGVYRLPGQPRVIDAIEAACGMNEFADTDYINQAMLIEDGQKIYVPTREETAAMGDASMTGDIALYDGRGETGGRDEKVNINTADAAELMTLPGIGEAKAALIIEYRSGSGGFKAIEDIMNISGIKEGMFNRIKDKICI